MPKLPTTAALLDRIWRRTLQAHDWRLGYLHHAAVEHTRRWLRPHAHHLAA